MKPLDPNSSILEEEKDKEEDNEETLLAPIEVIKHVKFDKASDSEERSDPDKLNLDEDQGPQIQIVSSEKLNELIDEEFSKEFSDKMLFRIFLLNFICSVSVNADHGTLPGCSDEVKAKMGIENTGFGALGTIVYTGITIGSALAAKQFSNSQNIKKVLLGSLAMNGLFLILFTLSSNFMINMFIRFCTGVF